MQYNFDEVIDRRGTNCCKWDGAEKSGHSPDEISMWVADMDFRCPQPAIDALVMQRYEAKKAKNFAEADRIRDELKAQGIEITDVKGGASWKRV